ncbi:CybS-domain-containing protein [Syncephalis fuscata]|nr:CybS-domain-containing protein [Syncephalis fuscata]
MALRLLCQQRAMARRPMSLILPQSTAVSLARLHTSAPIRQEVPSVSTHPPQNPDKMHGSYHWDFERAIAIAMPALIASTAIKGANPVTDALLGVVLPIHTFMGFDACLRDYVDKRKFPTLGPVAKGALWVSFVTVLYGCYHLNTEDIGMTELVIKAWKA